MTSTRKTLGALALTLHTALASITSVEVTYTPPEKPTAHTPRVYLALTKGGVEPKSRINDWFNLPILFAIDDIDRDGKVTLTPELLGTTGQLKSLKQGTYWAQTVIRINDDWPMPGTGTGDLFSKTQKIRIIPETPLTLNFTADQKIPAPKFRTKGPVRDAYFRSKSLTQFHERPFNMRYTVMLPKNWNPAKKYPLVIYIFGYTGVHTADNYVSYELGEGTTDVITLIPDANCYWGHSVFADSEVNGPWGKALTEELIPFVEKTYGGLGPKHRYVTGTSSGGWASLWLKLRYPHQYESCWSCAPDPLDFQEFLKVDLYKDKSLYRKPSGLLRPMTRIMGFSLPLIPLSDSNGTNAGVISHNSKARRGSGVGTMTEEKRSYYGKAPSFFLIAKRNSSSRHKNNIRPV